MTKSVHSNNHQITDKGTTPIVSKCPTDYGKRPYIYDKQAEVAERALNIILRNNAAKIQQCRTFEWYILMPYYKALSEQMIDRVKEWISHIREKGNSEDIDYSDFLREIHPTNSRTHIHDHVIRLGTGAKDGGEKKKVRNEMEKFNAMVDKIKRNRDCLFLVVIDEAHFGVNETSEFTSFFNQTNFDNMHENVITLQVSATPYTMMTQYTRIPESNVINWLSEGEDEGNYYGIKSYYETVTTRPNMSNSLAGQILVDSEYESMVFTTSKGKPHSRWEMLSEFVFSKLEEKGYEKKDSVSEQIQYALKNSIRLACTATQYMQAMMKLRGYSDDKLATVFKGGHFTHWKKLSKLAENTFRIITGVKEGDTEAQFRERGKMCLLRVKQQFEAKFIYRILRKLRKTIHLDNAFAIILDIDDDHNTSGIKSFNEEEYTFTKRLRHWKNDPHFCVERYEDLLGMHILLLRLDRIFKYFRIIRFKIYESLKRYSNFFRHSSITHRR